MPRIQGVGPRIGARLVEMGFRQPSGKPDVRAFARFFDYDKTLVYEWIADRRTPTKEVARLCADLQLSHGWLLYGEGTAEPYKPLTPIGGGADGCPTLPLANYAETLSLIRLWLRTLATAWARPLLFNAANA